ncbi:UNVERIFIED_CONTAM: hypothetical protein Sindi_1994500 [Sesamum indicum]
MLQIPLNPPSQEWEASPQIQGEGAPDEKEEGPPLATAAAPPTTQCLLLMLPSRKRQKTPLVWKNPMM